MTILAAALILTAAAVALTVNAGSVATTTTAAAAVSNAAVQSQNDVGLLTTGECNASLLIEQRREMIEEDDDDDEGSSTISESSYQVSSPAAPEAAALGADMGEAQVIEGDKADEIRALIQQARTYLDTKIRVDPTFSKVKDLCVNQHALCAFWGALGECEANPGYMQLQCGPICQSCDQLHIETRCPMDPKATDAFEPGDLNAMFERIVTDPWYQQFEPVVLSRPTLAPGDTEDNVTYTVGNIWMIMFEKAMSHEEADRMIELGGIEGYERSADVGEERADGTFDQDINSGRTSTNAWCQNDCYEDPVAKRLMERVENITGIPEVNSEYFQLLRYEMGQYYQTHNDYIPHQVDRPSGVRILTFYFYLNDVAEGGGTNFPRVGATTVQPKKGRAVLWPSVHNDNPNKKDGRSDHQAMPVLEGTKYGCNAWLHQRDFKTNNRKGC